MKRVSKKLEGKIRKAAKEGRITFAPTTRVKKYNTFVDDFIEEIFNTKGALITDASSIFDFAYDIEDKDAVYRRILNIYGVKVKPKHIIVDILDEITKL